MVSTNHIGIILGSLSENRTIKHSEIFLSRSECLPQLKVIIQTTHNLVEA